SMVFPWLLSPWPRSPAKPRGNQENNPDGIPVMKPDRFVTRVADSGLAVGKWPWHSSNKVRMVRRL
ncbi:MAG: hypothetical protein WCC64_15515, partial [Aliidongia sp.]